MNTFKTLTTTLLLAGVTLAAPPEDPKKLQADVDSAVESFKRADSSLTNTFKKALGYAVFPSVGKGGFIVGGAGGDGQVYENGKLIGYASLSQVTVGAQIGGQELSEIIFFETKEALAKFKEGGYSMSAQVSAVAAAEGVSQNAKYVEGVMVFTKARQGLMAEASIGGQKFKFEPLPKEKDKGK